MTKVKIAVKAEDLGLSRLGVKLPSGRHLVKDDTFGEWNVQSSDLFLRASTGMMNMLLEFKNEKDGRSWVELSIIDRIIRDAKYSEDYNLPGML